MHFFCQLVLLAHIFCDEAWPNGNQTPARKSTMSGKSDDVLPCEGLGASFHLLSSWWFTLL